MGVVVEVTHRDRAGKGAGGEGGVGRRAEAVARSAEQYRDVVTAPVGDRQIGVGVAVEVAHRNREGVGEGGAPDPSIDGRRAKVLIGRHADPHREVVGGEAGDRQLGVGVAVEVAHGDRVGLLAGWLGEERPEAGGERRVGRLGEAPGRPAKQYRHVVGGVVGDRQVGVGVAVEVAHCNRDGLVAAGGDVRRAAEAHLGQRPRRQCQRHGHGDRAGHRRGPPLPQRPLGGPCPPIVRDGHALWDGGRDDIRGGSVGGEHCVPKQSTTR